MSAAPPGPSTAPTGTGGLRDLLDGATGALVRDGHAPAAVAAAVRGDERVVVAAGRLGLGPAPAADTGALFALGSVTKTFTGLLLAELVAHGEVAHDDPIEEYLPVEAMPRRRADPPVTLLDLATHTGGLPRLPRNIYRHGLGHWISDPYGAYRTADLYRATARLRPGRRTVRYSTFGVGLLGRLLANAVGTDYPALLAHRVLGPLGMTGSGVPTTGSPPARAATGHRRGRPVRPWTFDALAPAGALHSSGDDLLRYLDAHLHPHTTPLAAALLDTHRPRRTCAGGRDRMGLVWMCRVIGGRTLFWHTGGTGGFTSYVGFSPVDGVGVAVLANTMPTTDQPVVRAGRRLLKAVLPATG